MIPALLVRSVAEAELAEAVEWYSARSPAVAARFLAAVDEAMEQVARDPETIRSHTVWPAES